MNWMWEEIVRGVEGDDGTRAWRSDDYIIPSRELRTISGCQSNPQHN